MSEESVWQKLARRSEEVPDEVWEADAAAEYKQAMQQVQETSRRFYAAKDRRERAEMTASMAPTTRHIGEYIMAINPSDPFYKALGEVAELHARKSQDYGTDQDSFANVRASEEFGVPAWLGAVIRANDKMTRLKSMVRNGSLANESARDSMVDMAVYMIIATCLWDEEQVVAEG